MTFFKWKKNHCQSSTIKNSLSSFLNCVLCSLQQAKNINLHTLNSFSYTFLSFRVTAERELDAAVYFHKIFCVAPTAFSTKRSLKYTCKRTMSTRRRDRWYVWVCALSMVKGRLCAEWQGQNINILRRKDIFLAVFVRDSTLWEGNNSSRLRISSAMFCVYVCNMAVEPQVVVFANYVLILVKIFCFKRLFVGRFKWK